MPTYLLIGLSRLSSTCMYFLESLQFPPISTSGLENYPFIHSFTGMCRMRRLPFSAASSVSLCCAPFPSTQFHQLVFRPFLLRLAIYFSVYSSALLFPNSYLILSGDSVFFHSLYFPNQRNLLSNHVT